MEKIRRKIIARQNQAKICKTALNALRTRPAILLFVNFTKIEFIFFKQLCKIAQQLF